MLLELAYKPVADCRTSLRNGLKPPGKRFQVQIKPPKAMVPRRQIRRPLENRLAGQQAKHKENDKYNEENNEKYTRDPAADTPVNPRTPATMDIKRKRSANLSICFPRKNL